VCFLIYAWVTASFIVSVICSMLLLMSSTSLYRFWLLSFSSRFFLKASQLIGALISFEIGLLVLICSFKVEITGTCSESSSFRTW